MGDPKARPTLASVTELKPGGAAPSEHIVQFYGGAEFLGETVARFLAEGFARGEAVLAIATAEHTCAIEDALTAKGFDVARAKAKGQLVVLDAANTLAKFLIGDRPDWERFRAVVGGTVASCIAGTPSGRLRAYGEMVDVLWREGRQQAALQLEEYWNRLGATYPMSLLCAYVMGNFFKESDAPGFQHVCDLHHRVLPSETYSESGDDRTRLRQVSVLQQRALALETELVHRKELEAALLCAREQAEQANRAKDDFLAMLGHELRNPLSPILTAVELMRLRTGGRFSREQHVIERQTRHLVRLVDDLLDVSRLTRGDLEVRRGPVDVTAVVAKAREIAGPLLDVRKHHVQVDVAAGLSLPDADEARLAQVVANLLTNAAKYTPPGGHISVAARRDKNAVVIDVRDDGIGIAADLLPRIFDLFVQGRQDSARGDGGLGVGLALARSLVELHGGQVTAHSGGPGRGSVFTVRLPFQATPEEKPRLIAVSPAPRRILVVDDNIDAVEMLAELLRIGGHDVRAAGEGQQALDIARDFRPELAILDIGLPGMDGYELAGRLRRTMGGEAPVLFALTGYGQEADRKRCEAAGFARHLLKPLEADELLHAVAALS